MKKNIKDYYKIQEKLDREVSWYDKQLMRIDFRVEENIFNEKRTVLYLDTKIANTTDNQIFLEKLKFVDVRDLSLKEVNYSPIDRLIIQDTKETSDSYSKDMRFYVHDDSSYGENDGYNYIAFYCASIEAIGLEEFPYSDF